MTCVIDTSPCFCGRFNLVNGTPFIAGDGKAHSRVECARYGDFIITASGRHFYPLDARPDEITIDDIAHHLAQVTRWTGAAPVRYSVAQHSVHVSHRAEALAIAANKIGPNIYAPACVGLMGLLHDASEAYLADVAKPIKGDLTNYHTIESGLQRVIGVKFGVQLDPLIEFVTQADLDLLVTEASVFFPNETWWRPKTATVHNKGGAVLKDDALLRDLHRGVHPDVRPELHWKYVSGVFWSRFNALTDAMAHTASSGAL